jgi:hypothetical protein
MIASTSLLFWALINRAASMHSKRTTIVAASRQKRQ